jgi:hypothetical protein
MATPAEALWPLAPFVAMVMAIAALIAPKGYGRIALAFCFSVLTAIPINGRLGIAALMLSPIGSRVARDLD